MPVIPIKKPINNYGIPSLRRTGTFSKYFQPGNVLVNTSYTSVIDVAQQLPPRAGTEFALQLKTL